jgi:glycosidase
MLFDAPLQMKFHEASRQGRDYDMSQIFTDTLVEADPFHAVTLVANHDTQPLQALEAPVEPWFKPLAYALILLRKMAYRRCFTLTSTGRITKTPAAMAKPILSTCRSLNSLMN